MSENYGFYYCGKNRNYYYDVYGGDLVLYYRYQDGTIETDDPQHIEFISDGMTFMQFKARCEELESEANGLSN